MIFKYDSFSFSRSYHLLNMWIRSNLEFTFLFWSVSAPTCRVLRHRSTAGASGFPRHLPNIWNSAKMVIEWDCEIGDWDYIILHYPNMWQASTFNNHWRNLSQPSTARTKLSNDRALFSFAPVPQLPEKVVSLPKQPVERYSRMKNTSMTSNDQQSNYIWFAIL